MFFVILLVNVVIMIGLYLIKIVIDDMILNKNVI